MASSFSGRQARHGTQPVSSAFPIDIVSRSSALRNLMRMQSDVWYLAMPGTTVTFGPAGALAADVAGLAGPTAAGPVAAGPVAAEGAELVADGGAAAAGTGRAGLTGDAELADGEPLADSAELAGGAGLTDGAVLADGAGLTDGAELADGAGLTDGAELAGGAALADGTGRSAATVAGPVHPAEPGELAAAAAAVGPAAAGSGLVASGVELAATAGDDGLAAGSWPGGFDDPVRAGSGTAGRSGPAPAPTLTTSAEPPGVPTLAEPDGVPAPAEPDGVFAATGAFAVSEGATRVFSRVEGPRSGVASGGVPAAERAGPAPADFAAGWPSCLVTSGRFESGPEAPEAGASGVAMDAAATRPRAASSPGRAAAGSCSGRPAGDVTLAGESVLAAGSFRTAGSGRAGT